MPKVTVYLRNEDLDLWKAVEKKAEFLHNALNTDFSGLKDIVDDTVYIAEAHNADEPKLTNYGAKSYKFCAHGAAIGYCKKGCKK